MRRFTLLFAALLCVVIAKAQSYAAATFTYSDDGKTCTITNGTGGSINLDADQSDRPYASEISKIKNNCTKVIIDGEVKSLNAFQNNTNAPTYVDMSNATFVDWQGNATAGSGFSGFKNVQTAIIPNNETSTSGQYFQNCNNITTIQYKSIVATGSGSNFSFTESGNNTDDRFFENLLTNNGKSVKVIKATKTTWDAETGTLTVSKTDGTESKLKEIVESADYCNGKENVNKIVFSDGSIWEKSTGKLTAYSEAEAHQAALVAAGFTVESTSEVQIIGNYVKIIDGVTIVTDPKETTEGLETWLTSEEIAALGSATNLKLVGNVGNNALAKIGAASTPTTVDLTEAIISEGQDTYTYYYLDIDDTSKRNVRYTQKDGTLKNEGGTWYYKDGDTWNAIEGSKVRIYDCEVTGGAKMPDNWKGSLTTLSLPTNSDYNVLGADFCNGFSSLSSVTIPNNITVISNKAFNSNTSLKNVSLPEGLVVIGDYAFYQTGLESVSIPGSVELIDYKAFSECASIAKISFEESDANHHMLVKQESFVFNEECPLRDIYINTSALIDCENWAFDSKVTWGHGDVTRDLCTLHFKADVADHYANLSHPLTTEIAKDAGKFHKWLHQHYQFASDPGANGWWELVNNGTIGDPDDPSMVKGKKFLRTYSDYHYDRIVPAGVKAYIVKGLKKNSDGDYCLDLLQILVIPKRTGVILYGEANSKDENDNPILSMSLCEIANGVPLRRDYWDYLQGKDKDLLKNYLWPTCVDMAPDAYKEEGYYYYHLDEEGNLMEKDGYYMIDVMKRNVLREATAPFKVQPYNEQKGFVTPNESQYLFAHYNGENLNGFFRNFYMARYSTTNSGKAYKAQNNNKIESDFVSFFRAKKNSTIKPGMAYLHLKADEYEDAQGGEVIINPDTDTERYDDMMSYQVEFNKTTGAPITPAVSGYWVLNLPENGPRPNMDWDREDNWGNRDLVAKKPEGQGAKFIAVNFAGEPEIIENGDGTATMIVPSSMIEDVDKGVYYNLQGVKVTNPSKGVYIKNGKKVVLN